MADFKVGRVTHYYDKISVAVIDVLGTIAVGDKVKIKGRDQEFEQVLESMQVEHESVKTAKKGDTIGLKVDQPVKKGDEIFKIS
ncbi:MAG TPA: translation elongation factor-like protein [Candidatus Bathyarchaeia archaeon]|nr:translation elongation factor-like protein [Candidatus Bathyarchaeia archaeon]